MSTYPTYRSPIRTFQQLGISTENIDQNQLKLERKRLLLEIQISDSQRIQFGEKELSKNDVIELFDELDRVSHLDYHTAIFNHPVLLNLLENHKVSGNILDSHKIRYKTQEEWDEFIEFISPYLANALDKLLSSVIRSNNFKDFEKVQPFFKLLTPTDAFFAFRKFNNFCETLEDRLNNLTFNRAAFPSEQVTFLSFHPFYTCVNDLARVYPNLPDSVASAVINFTVNSERQAGRGRILVDISEKAILLNCSEKLRVIITGNRTAFRNSQEQKSSFDPNVVWRVLVGLVVIGSLLFRVSNRCGSSNNSSIDNIEFMEQLRQIQENKNYRYTPSSGPKGTSGFDESAFLDLHASVVDAEKFSNYVSNPLSGAREPGIISRFRNDSIGTKFKLHNETYSDMIMVVWADSSLNSFFVRSGNTIDFSAEANSCMFFYSGTKWRTNSTIHHMHNSTTLISFNGAFTNASDEEFEFLRKYFTLTDGESQDFTIKDEDSGYQLYQGDRFVNYSY